MSIPLKIILQVRYIGDTSEPELVGSWMRPHNAYGDSNEIPFDYIEYRLVDPSEKSKLERIRAEISGELHKVLLSANKRKMAGLTSALEIIDRIQPD